MIPDTAISRAISLFEYREQATGRVLPCDPNWHRVVEESVEAALSGARGSTDQQQCVYQAIRLADWESGRRPKPWTKAFMPVVEAQVELPSPWYRRWWGKFVNWYRSILKHAGI